MGKKKSVDAEFRSIALRICKIMWLKRFFSKMRLSSEKSMSVFYDNQVAINIAKNPVYDDSTKHIEIGLYFIKEKIENDVM